MLYLLLQSNRRAFWTFQKNNKDGNSENVWAENLVAKVHCGTCSCNLTFSFGCRYSVVESPMNIMHTKFGKAGMWKRNAVFCLSNIIASQPLGCAFDSLFSWWLSLNCKTAIKWVWDSSCSCRGLVSWHRSQTQNTSPDRQSIRTSQTVKLLLY